MVAQGMKIAALFVGYGAVGAGGDYAAATLERGLRSDVHGEADPAVVHADSRQRGGWGDECRHEARRSVTLDVAGARALRVSAGSGDLEVEGRAGIDRVQAEARACASEESELEDLVITLEREGSDLVLSAHYPDRDRRSRREGRYYARLDIVVQMPIGMDVDLDDSSGGIHVSGAGALTIDDSSGEITVEGAAGPVSIDDSSGEIYVRDVAGDLDIRDGSGEIVVSGVGGTVRLSDGSGSIEVEDARRDVIVENDGSGSISVRDVGGNFTVRSDGSGSVRHVNVAGTVDVPRDKRHRRRGG